MWGWRNRSDAERVDLYTQATLYTILWLMPLVVVAPIVRGLREDPWLLTGTLLILLGLCIAGTQTLRVAIARHPAPGPLPWPWMAVVAALVLAGGAAASAAPSQPAGGIGIMVTMLASIGLGGFRDRRVAWGVPLAFGLLVLAVDRDPGVALLTVGISAFMVFTVRASLWTLQVVYELDRAEQEKARLAVAEERLRFSRDVHDVLGRRLSTIAVQADLAAALARREDPAAVDRIREVRETANEALRETRALARGYRRTDLEQELQGARSLLRAAGTELSVAVDDLPARWQEPAGWVVREAVTNVLRHSTARRMDITYADSVLRLRNDGAQPTGAGPTGAGPTGTGLIGLRERLEPLGATLGIDQAHDRFEVTVSFPTARQERQHEEASAR